MSCDWFISRSLENNLYRHTPEIMSEMTSGFEPAALGSKCEVIPPPSLTSPPPLHQPLPLSLNSTNKLSGFILSSRRRRQRAVITGNAALSHFISFPRLHRIFLSWLIPQKQTPTQFSALILKCKSQGSDSRHSHSHEAFTDLQEISSFSAFTK